MIQEALGGRGVSATAAARAAGLNRDAIRSVLRGRSPSIGRVAEICRALNLEFYVGPRRAAGSSAEEQISPDTEAPSRPPMLTNFTSTVTLPVYEWDNDSQDGEPSTTTEGGSAPAPVDLPDPKASFYLRAPGHSMIPARIWPGDYCLVSTFVDLKAPQRVWLQDESGKETIRCLMRIAPTWYDLLGWRAFDPETERQEMTAPTWSRTDVVKRGVVLAVYRGLPSVEEPPFKAPNWLPDRASTCSWPHCSA